MDISLRSAIMISVIIHAGFFAPFCNSQLLKMELEKRKSVVVDYVVLKEIAQALQTNKEVVLKSPETPKIDIQKEMTEKKEDAGRKEAQRKVSEARELKEKAKTDDGVKAAEKEARKKEEALKSNKDYINYYQLVREKIRSRLKNNYRYYNNEGDVYLSFTINSNGTLRSYEIDKTKSTSDEVLLHITAESLKAVSPFPMLPKVLAVPKMSFSIIISFKK